MPNQSIATQILNKTHNVNELDAVFLADKLRKAFIESLESTQTSSTVSIQSNIPSNIETWASYEEAIQMELQRMLQHENVSVSIHPNTCSNKEEHCINATIQE